MKKREKSELEMIQDGAARYRKLVEQTTSPQAKRTFSHMADLTNYQANLQAAVQLGLMTKEEANTELMAMKEKVHQAIGRGEPSLVED